MAFKVGKNFAYLRIITLEKAKPESEIFFYLENG
jgi:hypothetical protein